MHKVVQQIPYYIPLVAIFMVGFFGFFVFSYDKTFQVGVVTAVGVAHVAWGIVYHVIHHDLTVTTVLEYIILAAFGIAAVLAVIG